MTQELDGRVAIVTGAGQGIGEQVARKLSGAGAPVVISDVDADRAQAVADDLPGDVVAAVGDLTEPGEADRAVAVAADAWGRLDIVVNNAGYAWDGPLHKGHRRAVPGDARHPHGGPLSDAARSRPAAA